MSLSSDSRVAIRTPDYYRRLSAYEEADPWARAMADWSLELIRRYAAPQGDLVVVDVGCGAGGFLKRVSAAGRVGLDVDPTALRVASELGPRSLGQAAAESLPLVTGSVDVVLLHDVLQHAPTSALGEAARALRSGGLLVLRTAARRGLLWKKHVDSEDYRQWTPGELRNLCAAAGLEVRILARANALPSLARDLVALSRSERPRGDVGLSPPPRDPRWKQALLDAYWRAERSCLLAGLRVPWGHSLLLAATRK